MTANVNSANQSVFLSLLLAALVFAVDVSLPLGVASAVPYALTVMVALRSPSRRFVPRFALLCSVLTVAHLFIGPGRGGTELWKVLTNRSLAVFMIWVTAILGLKRKHADERRRRAEEQTRQHLADLAHVGRLKTAGQLAASLAHELNQPLAAISLQAEVAARLAEQDGERGRESLVAALHEITEQSQRAAAIIRTVRGLVQKTEPQRSPVDLSEIVHEITRLLEAELERSGVELQLRLSNTPLVQGDKIQLEQVLVNLLQNAIDAVLAADGPRRVTIETSVGGEGQVIVSVRDTGIGLAAGDVERIFERFYSTKPNGMGMGLAISRSILEAHGGKLWATSNPDRGATFTFVLPIKRQD